MEQPTSRELGSLRRRATRAILAVGNDRTSLNGFAQQLGALGYLVVLSDSMSQALELISARGFDLVLLDMNGPDAPGLHMVREIRGSRDTSDLPMLFLTCDSRAVAIVDALHAGADDCIAKPFDFALLAARIERVLARAARIDELKRSNLALDARIASRAIELGEVRSEMANVRADRARLLATIQALHEELGTLKA
ncbi:response regulator transcription factor [Sphingomonas sp. CJ20]